MPVRALRPFQSPCPCLAGAALSQNQKMPVRALRRGALSGIDIPYNLGQNQKMPVRALRLKSGLMSHCPAVASESKNARKGIKTGVDTAPARRKQNLFI